MNLNAVKQQFLDLEGQLGRTALNAIYPYDFEVYMMAFELVDSKGNTIDYFAFPIMPESISKVESKRTNVKKTAGGITVLTSQQFTPQDITISGNFGRSFKFLMQPKESAVQGVAFSVSSGVYDSSQVSSSTTKKFPTFSPSVKNGFGATKILQSLIDKSTCLDKDGLPMRLYFYNMALSEQYLVVVPPQGLTLSMTKDKNMIWSYSLQLTAIANLDDLKGTLTKTSLFKLCSLSAIQNNMTKMSRSINQTILG